MSPKKERNCNVAKSRKNNDKNQSKENNAHIINVKMEMLSNEAQKKKSNKRFSDPRNKVPTAPTNNKISF